MTFGRDISNAMLVEVHFPVVITMTKCQEKSTGVRVEIPKSHSKYSLRYR